MTETVGVLAMAYGTASGPEDIERYYTDIRGGRAPSPEHLEELTARYAAIGNRFPLLDITRRQASALEAELNMAGDDGVTWRAYLGMKHSPPFVAEGVAQMRRDGVERALGLVLAPHWSGMSVETYVERVERAVAQEGGPSFTFVRSWYEHPFFLDFLATRVEATIRSLPVAVQDGAAVIFSAHSLPTRRLEDGSLRCTSCFACEETGCRYVRGLVETGELVATRLNLRRWRIAWQSAGRTPDPWWGPPVGDVIRDLALQGAPAVVACSAGFVSDHLEILYDLDLEARQVAEEAGIAFARTEMPNDDPMFIRALAAVVREHAGIEVA
jgi:ferrochelatase